MKFSIAMATFNGSKYIREQLDSFARQTHKPFELVICDDGSTDNTLKIIDDFSEISPFPIRVFSNEKNLGFVQNFAKAISLCEGDWIALSDHDDIWFDDKLSIIKDRLNDNKETKICIHDYILTDSDLIIKKTSKMERLKLSGKPSSEMISGCATIFHRSCLDFILPIPEGTKAHDSWIHKFFSYDQNKRLIITKPLMYYRRHDNNASSSFESTNKYKSRVNSLIHYRVSNPLPGYVRRLEELEIITSRFNKIDDEFFNYLEFYLEIEIIKKRIKILKSGFPSRQLLALDFYIDNRYSKFNGVISFVNDFIRLRGNKLQ